MAEIIRMPRLSDTMEEGNIVGWLKKVGDSVAPGDILAEVETDKATMELESFEEGVLLYIGVKEGPVAVDGILAVIGKKGEDFKALLDSAQTESKANDLAVEKEEEKTKSPKTEAAKTTASTQGVDTHIKASPLARSMAAKANISLDILKGTGEGGRIVKKDIEHAISNGLPTKSSNQSVSSYNQQIQSDFEFGTHQVSQMRKTIARRLSESKFSAPHFYLTIEINMDKSVQARKEINADGKVKISFNDLIVKSCAVALQNHPKINGSWKGDTMEYHQDVNIGVAVAVEEGLVVPVVKNANFKSLSNINSEVRDLAGRARDKKLKLDEMTGNTFTISNLGMFDIEEFTAIINPPDACILAVGSIVKKPVVVNDQIQISSMMKVTLSCDHRIVDGATGAQFLQTFKSYLENPVRILV